MENPTPTGGSTFAQASVTPAAQKRSLAMIFSIMLMDIVGISILAPVAPYIVQRYSGEALMVTMVTVLYAASQFFGAPLLGKLGDRYGRRSVLLASLLGQAAGYLIFGIGGSLGVLFAARLIGGITGGNLSTASAYIADISKPEERSKNFTLIGIAWGTGLILGPALGSVFGQISLEMPAFAAAMLSLLNVGLSVLLLPESLPRERRERTPIRASDFNPIHAIVEMARKPSLGWILLVMALFNFSFNAINSTATLFIMQKFNAQTGEVGLLLVLGGVALAVVQFLLVRRLVPRFGEKRVAMSSLIGQAFSAVAIFSVPALWMVFPLNMIANAFSGFTFPTMTTLTTNRVLPREVGLLMGVSTAIGSLMNIAGPLWAGVVYDSVMPGAPYWMGAVVYVVAAFMLVRVTNVAPLQETVSLAQAE